MLPKCMKLPADDFDGGETLKSDGWRHIGFLNDYYGTFWLPFGKHSPLVERVQPPEVINIAKEINWGGRYWLDPHVSEEEAWRQTRDGILKTAWDVYKLKDAAFAIVGAGRVRLVGVHPNARGLGLAETILRHALHGCKWIAAGTYAGNRAATKLYHNLGMKKKSMQAVYHKDQP